MEIMKAIRDRRSIRRFTNASISSEDIETLLLAASLAPSGKNKQPWRFVVVREDKRDEMIRVMRAGIETCKKSGIETGSSEGTARIMEQAPVTIFIFNPFETNEERERTISDHFMQIVDIQSVGAAIQNLLLAAWDRGIGSLWICDVFYAYGELCEWLGENHQMVAAVSLGYPAESPGPRPRRSVSDLTSWL
jgi:nitroreductase